MVKISLMIATALSIVGIAPAMADSMGHRHHRLHHHHHVHRAYHHRVHHRHAGWRDHVHRGPYTIGYGDTIISGRTGLHRSTFGQMVPDSPAGDPILTGRRRGSGLGANGLPGSNLDD